MGIVKPFSTVTEMFDVVTSTFADSDRPMLMHKVEGKWEKLPFRTVRRNVELFANGLAALGIKRDDRVALMSENRPEWVFTDMACLSLGAIDVPLYPSLTARQVEYICNNAGVKAAVVSNQFQLTKMLKAQRNIKTLRFIVVMSEKGAALSDSVLSFNRVYELGETFERENPTYLKVSLRQVRPEDLATLIYTSGTTGEPKGVMLTHRNFVSNMISSLQVIDFTSNDVLLSFLPLSHSFERMAGYYAAMSAGATIAYAESVETVAENLKEIRPTVVTTVPRLFERIYSKIQKNVDHSSPLKRKIFYWAVDVGRKYARAKKEHRVGATLKMQHALASKLVFEKLQEATGGRMRFFVSGGAALARELGEFFEAVGIRIIEGYGLTESSPVISVNRLDDYKFGTVGKPIPGVEVKIAPDGEILARGPNIMKGYWNDRRATEEAIDKDGWLHTGDIGVFDAAGFLVITDRKKHLFVSSGGKNIAPQPIENLFLQSKYIDQFVLIGDRRMFLSALIVPDFDAIREYADAHKIPYKDITDLTRNEEIYKIVEQDIQRLQRDLANYERVRRFVLLDHPLSIENGELTPTLKTRRQVIEERYRDLIESMYRGPN
ncbi:MAG: AMP-dependent synthetase/ligase [Bacteroidota bacterium]